MPALVEIPRESVEYLELDVTATDPTTGQPVDVTGLQAVIVPSGGRPDSGWTATVTLSGRQHVLIAGLAPGFYTVYGRLTNTPETVVFPAGTLRIT